MEIEILAPDTTDGVTTTSFAVENGKFVTIALFPEANIGADTAVLKRLAPSGPPVGVKDKNGAVILGANRPQEVVFGSGGYLLTVATRTASWGISINLD